MVFAEDIRKTILKIADERGPERAEHGNYFLKSDFKSNSRKSLFGAK